ncbi:MAG: hypothetical protein CMJ75_18860 [Planctomycetaceae bacterium]|nr:hypothetical protein [Planctomycetaceae bacterium]
MSRGRLTNQIREIAQERLGREIDQVELRLYPYLQYTMMNDQRLDPAKINGEERKILQSLREGGFIEGGASGLSMTKDFWDAINEILWISYVERGAE